MPGASPHRAGKSTTVIALSSPLSVTHIPPLWEILKIRVAISNGNFRFAAVTAKARAASNQQKNEKRIARPLGPQPVCPGDG
jgi:hypothetical protein